MRDNQNFTCYILAGGKSSRMGRDKGLLMLSGKSITQILIEKLGTCFNEIVIVSNNQDYEQFGCKVIPDAIQNIGPAGGIYTALDNCNCDKIFVISCDMPFVNTDAIAFMVEKFEGHDIVLPFYQNHPEPLFSVLSKSCLEVWKKSIDKGVFKLQDIMANFNTLHLHVDKNDLFGEDFFFNVNTESHLEEAKRKLENEN